MGTNSWNGLDKLSASDVLALYRPDAARWWRECVDVEGQVDAAHIEESAIELASVEQGDRDEWRRAYEYAATCALK